MIEVKKDHFSEEMYQVIFWDEDSGFYREGLMFHMYVFCACCGKKMLIEELFESAAEFKESNGLNFDIKPILVFEEWDDSALRIAGLEDIYEILSEAYTIEQQKILFPMKKLYFR